MSLSKSISNRFYPWKHRKRHIYISNAYAFIEIANYLPCEKHVKLIRKCQYRIHLGEHTEIWQYGFKIHTKPRLSIPADSKHGKVKYI